jgi:hypothetical protein
MVWENSFYCSTKRNNPSLTISLNASNTTAGVWYMYLLHQRVLWTFTNCNLKKTCTTGSGAVIEI